ncbi:MAG: hypothetical protein F6K47_08420 [Symploca sp. SIO2E6]|nr:hypothetical protein [Symploca sp. SIO2E6]
MSPHTYQQWLAVAKQRASDAEAISKHQPQSVGSVYLAGYAIECSLKALLHRQGRPFPQHGNEGHNLKGLWEASGFRLCDLQDTKGIQTFFLQEWNTAWRYETTIPSNPGLAIADLMQGAKLLTGKIQTAVRRRPKRR